MSLQWKPRKKMFENYNRQAWFDPELCVAYSYGWYCILRRMYLKGKPVIIVNANNYSNQTAKHIGAVRRLIGYENIGLRIHAPRGLDDLPAAAEWYAGQIAEMEMKINAKGSRTSTNLERLKLIDSYHGKIKTIGQLIKEEMANEGVTA